MIGSLPVFGGGRFSGVRVVVEVALVGLSPVGGFAVTNLTRHGHRLGVIGSRKLSKMTKKEPIFEEKSLKKTPLAHSKNHKYI